MSIKGSQNIVSPDIQDNLVMSLQDPLGMAHQDIPVINRQDRRGVPHPLAGPAADETGK